MAEPEGVTVTGTGRAGEVPDVFVVEIAAAAQAATPALALDAAGAALVAMRSAALAEGVPPEELTTRDLQIHPHHDHQGVPQGFAAELALTIRVTGDARPGELLTACVTAGGDAARLQRTSFEHSDPSVLQSRAREAAFADARTHALQYAALAGRDLGAVRSVVESVPGPVPFRGERMMAMSASSGPPVDPGTLSAEASVTVTWSWA